MGQVPSTETVAKVLLPFFLLLFLVRSTGVERGEGRRIAGGEALLVGFGDLGVLLALQLLVELGPFFLGMLLLLDSVFHRYLLVIRTRLDVSSENPMFTCAFRFRLPVW